MILNLRRIVALKKIYKFSDKMSCFSLYFTYTCSFKALMDASRAQDQSISSHSLNLFDFHFSKKDCIIMPSLFFHTWSSHIRVLPAILTQCASIIIDSVGLYKKNCIVKYNYLSSYLYIIGFKCESFLSQVCEEDVLWKIK